MEQLLLSATAFPPYLPGGAGIRTSLHVLSTVRAQLGQTCSDQLRLVSEWMSVRAVTVPQTLRETHGAGAGRPVFATIPVRPHQQRLFDFHDLRLARAMVLVLVVQIALCVCG